VMLVTYKSWRHSSPASCTLRSSVWRKHGSAWQMAFHQGTPTTFTTWVRVLKKGLRSD